MNATTRVIPLAALLATGLSGCQSAAPAPASGPTTSPAALVRDSGGDNESWRKPYVTPYMPTQTKGNIRITLLGGGYKTIFSNVNVADAEPGWKVGTGEKFAIPCFEVEYVVEYLTDRPEKFTLISPGVSVYPNGREIASGYPAPCANLRSSNSTFVLDFADYDPVALGLPAVQRRERAEYRRVRRLGAAAGAERVDVEIEEELGGKIERFLFKNLPLGGSVSPPGADGP